MIQVEIEPDQRPLSLLGPEVTGLPVDEQVALVTVREPDRCSRHGIVSPGHPVLPLEVRLRKISALFPTRQVSLCLPLPHTDGEIRLISRPADPALLLAAAAAAATVQRSWAWDESPQIVVTIATPEEFRFVVDPAPSSNGIWVVERL